MFNLFKKRPSNLKGPISNIKLSLSGLHCTSCATNIDLTLEDLPGVTNSKTNYAKSLVTIDFDPQKTSPQKIIAEIKTLGYQAVPG